MVFMGNHEKHMKDHDKSQDSGYFCRIGWMYGRASMVLDKVSLLDMGSRISPS